MAKTNDTDTHLEARVRAAKENQTGPPSHKLLRLPEVEARVRIGRTSIYRNMKTGSPRFPQPIKMVGSSFWIESEIDAYIDSLVSARARHPE